ncbi:MAG: leucine--tRNA ligase [Pirellulaceae bacterium]|nr:leucine--tRNA ligase [Pirellulaceae bacterium]
MPRYTPAAIEPKWQQYWAEHQTFRTPDMPAGQKLYVLDMFPYPSGSGLHVGHPEGYTATDIVCRFERMRGRTVLHPMGFDAFGLPAEEHAIKTGEHPRSNTENNIREFTRHLKMLGFSYDWDRVLATTDVEYFRWTQWIFLVLFDTWFDAKQQKGRPISELPIPEEVKSQGEDAVRKYQDEHRLAYQADALVNWCPALGTVLANEEVIDGKSERGSHPVVRMPLRQWMLRITAYADRLENDLEGLDWSSGIKKLQSDWIGRSVGAEVDFFVGQEDSGPAASSGQVAEFESWKATRAKSGFPKKPADDVLRIYTTRPDTLFGATYMVIAPEHPFVARFTTEKQRTTVEAYVQKAASKSDRDRQDVTKTKTGVFTGSHAINPVNGQQVPVWVADYVLWGYGTGAIMAVPAHDERDFEFATLFHLPVRAVVAPTDDWLRSSAIASIRKRAALDQNIDVLAAKHGQPNMAQSIRDGVVEQAKKVIAQSKTHELLKDYSQRPSDYGTFVGEGMAINSPVIDGLATVPAKEKITKWLAAAGLGREAVNYKLRDWLFSRQRFWGEPFPILHELDDQGHPTGMIRAVEMKDLPVDLPHLDDYKPHGRPEPPLAKAPAEWLYPVINGKKYRRETNTMPQWAGSCWYYLRFIDPRNGQVFVDREKEKAWMPVDLYVGGAEHAVLHLLYSRFWHKVLFDYGYVTASEPFQKLVNQGMILGENGEKMAKSRGNVINPDDVVKEFGADSLRLFEMFMGPLEAVKPWSTAGVVGVRGFLDRAWRLIVDDRSEMLALNASVQKVEPTDEQNRTLHKTIKQVTSDIEGMAFNTAIARMMEFVNFFTKQSVRPHSVMERFVLLLSPFAPHIAEELWQLLGREKTLAYEPWPTFDDALIKDAEIEIPVQILGKLRGKVVVPAGSDQATLVAAARAEPRIAELLSGKEVVKTIVVPGKLVNFVVR